MDNSADIRSEKIKFMADTASDIPDVDLKAYNIDMPSVPITVDGAEYLERRSFGIKEFYGVLQKSSEIPVTSRVPEDDFLQSYKNAYEEGYTDIICVTINAGGSGTNLSAFSARDALYREIPEAEGRIKIHIVDSRTYAMAYGLPVVRGAVMAREGKSVGEILDYLDDWFSRVEILLGCYSLEYAKKSGRIGAAAAFMGDVLGLRPIIAMIDGGTKTVGKVRGDKNLIPKISELCAGTYNDLAKGMIICAAELERGVEMQAQIKKDYGVMLPIYYAGASIVINSGPRIVAVAYPGKKRPPRSGD